MKKNVLFALFLFLSFQTSRLSAQIDTSFWFAAPWVTPDHTERHNVVVHISTFGAPSTTVHLYQPAALAPNKYDTTLILGANQTFDYIFRRDKLASGPPSTLTPNVGFDSLETRPADTVLPYGLHISSSSVITVVYDVITSPPGFNNPETFSLKGRNALGVEFVCPQQTLYRNRTLSDRSNTPSGVLQPRQQIVIVASMPNTVVWITPKCNVVGHLANVTYSVLLTAAGSCYNIENAVPDTYLPGKNLSGTSITSDKPIAVTVADDSINNIHSSTAEPGQSTWGGMGCYDLIGDQIVPVSVIGKDYIVNRGQLFRENQLGTNNPGMKESAFIVGTENSTQLTIVAGTLTLTATINKGDTYVDTLTSDLTYIHADKYIYVYHVSGLGCELGAALLPPLSCAGSSLVSFSRNTPQLFALNILCKSGAQNSFTLNGSSTLVPATAFTVVAGTSTLAGGPYYGAQVSLASISLLPVGSYTIGNSNGDFGLGVFDGSTASGGLYHYLTSFMNTVSVKTNSLNPLCLGASNTVALTGTVSGADATGIWTSANGTGIFASYSSTLNTIACSYSLSPADTLLTSIKFYLNSTGSCRPVKDSVTLSLSHQPNITVSSNVNLCKNNLAAVPLSATVTNALSGSWSGGSGGTFSSPGLNTSYTLSQTDTTLSNIVFTLTSQSPMPGCANASKTVTLNLLNPASVNAGTNVIVCGKTAPGVSLSGSVTGISNTGIWSTSGSGVFLPTPTALVNNYLFSSSDFSATVIVFTLTSTNNGVCLSVNDIVTVLRDTASVLIQTPSPSVCSGHSVSLTAFGTSGYQWSTGATTSVIIVSPTNNQTYSVTGTTSLNCASSATTNITVYPNPTITAIPDNSLICVGEITNLVAAGATSYNWVNVPSTATSVAVSPVVSTSYTLIGASVFGCTDTTSAEVAVDLCSGLNAKSPNEPLFSIYPNPNNGDFSIKSDHAIELKLMNDLGQLVRVIHLSSVNTFRVNVSGLAKGIYFLVGENKGVKINRKISISGD